jgi:hypothetical protein
LPPYREAREPMGPALLSSSLPELQEPRRVGGPRKGNERRSTGSGVLGRVGHANRGTSGVGVPGRVGARTKGNRLARRNPRRRGEPPEAEER